ncbi:MAG: hypothetical protein WB562_06040 [Candidatus Sulfotelmatobacter sp.]
MSIQDASLRLHLSELAIENDQRYSTDDKLDLVEQRKYSQAEPILRQALTYREKGDTDDKSPY